MKINLLFGSFSIIAENAADNLWFGNLVKTWKELKDFNKAPIQIKLGEQWMEWDQFALEDLQNEFIEEIEIGGL